VTFNWRKTREKGGNMGVRKGRWRGLGVNKKVERRSKDVMENFGLIV